MTTRSRLAIGPAVPTQNQKEKQLDRCWAQLTNPDKITVIYSLDRHYMWTLELSNPSWNFPKGAAFDVAFGTGNRNTFRQRVTALDSKLVRVQLPDTVNAFEALPTNPPARIRRRRPDVQF